MHDQHVHSNYSPDSKTKMEEYIKNSKDQLFTFTDHYDLTDPWNDYTDQVYSFKDQRREMDELEAKYNVEILQGIEIGYSKRSKERILKVLNENDFDIVLLSVHHNDETDYMENFSGISELDVVNGYFDKILEALNEVDDADVLTHLDFGLRVRKVSFDHIKSFEKKIEQILSKVIEKGMSLEINAKGIGRYNTLEMYRYFLKLYSCLGGKDIVVNSDAHTIDVYKSNFSMIKDFLISLGIHQLNYYKKRKKYSISI